MELETMFSWWRWRKGRKVKTKLQLSCVEKGDDGREKVVGGVEV